ncbi:MAG TPA: extracellular solute-binding protein [Candidatus Bathyarchaeota archaeon]|nr:extracellular solute-binding protein [Candidatus Bathyarchaeota archaeon]
MFVKGFTTREKVMFIIILVLALCLILSVSYNIGFLGRKERKKEVKIEKTVKKKEKIIVWTYWQDDSFSALEKAAKVFTDENNVSVVIEQVPLDEFYSKLCDALQRGEGPDIFIYSHDSLAELVSLNVIVPIAVENELDEFPPSVLQALTYENKLYALPILIEVPALAVNTKLVRNIPEDMEEILSGRTVVYGNALTLVYPLDNAFYSSVWFYSLGAYYYDSEIGKSNLDSDAGVKAFQIMLNLSDQVPEKANIDTSLLLFAQSEAAFTIVNPSILKKLKLMMGKDFSSVEIVPFPKVLGNTARPLMYIEAIYVTSLPRDARIEELTMDLAWFLATNGSIIIARDAELVVAWADAYTVDSSRILYGFYNQSLSAVPMPVKASKVFLIVSRYIDRVIGGELKPEDASIQCDNELEKL